MARELELKAELNFTFASHAELTSMRSAAASFAAANSGTYIIHTYENASEVTPYFGKLTLDFEPADRAGAAALMGTIDGALGSLPALVNRNGFELRYSFIEKER